MTAEEQKNVQTPADAAGKAQELDAEDLNAVSAGAMIFSEDDEPADASLEDVTGLEKEMLKPPEGLKLGKLGDRRNIF